MVDLDSKVFNKIYSKVTAVYSSADIATHYVREPASFPHVQVYEESNTAPRYGMNLSGQECFSNIVYHVEIFDNNVDGVGKKNCKAIAQLVDSAMKDLGFRRTYYGEVPNYQDASIYRLVIRFSRLQEN